MVHIPFPTAAWQTLPYFRYPENLTFPPFDKWIKFDVKSGRHIIRNGLVTEGPGRADRTLASVGLYLSPTALKTSIEAKYDSNDLGPFWGAAVELLAQTGKNLLSAKPNSVQERLSTGASEFLNVVEKVKTLADGETFGQAMLQQAKEAIQSFLSQKAGLPEHALDIVTGQKTNPKTDIFFDSVEYRTHELSFTLIPRSKIEAVAIDNIVHLFQFYMLPSYHTSEAMTQAKVGAFLIGYPYEFEIQFLDGQGQELGHINKIGRSVLTNVQVNHSAGDNVAFVKDNGEYYPVVTELSLSLQEVRLLGRDSKEIDRKNFTKDSREDPRTSVSYGRELDISGNDR